VADVTRIDPAHGPFPDLGIEIDVTSNSLNRMAIYAAFKVTELWRWEQDGQLRCYQLRDNGYLEVEKSQFLPKIAMTELQHFVEQGKHQITSKLIRQARQWALEKIR
jgi:Uma2 family endonuclease